MVNHGNGRRRHCGFGPKQGGFKVGGRSICSKRVQNECGFHKALTKHIISMTPMFWNPLARALSCRGE